MVQNKAFMYKSVPDGWPVPGKDLSVEDIGFDESAPPPKGGFTTKNLYATYDPSQRGRMRDLSIKSYSPAMIPGKPVISVHVIGKVLKSDNPKIKEGATVLLRSHYTEEYSTVPESAVETTQIIEPKPGVPLTAYLGLMGMTGMTAYGSLHEIGQPKPGDVILVSAAAGAVGQAVGQIAKKEGLHVRIPSDQTCPNPGALPLLVLPGLTLVVSRSSAPWATTENSTSSSTSSASPPGSTIRKKTLPTRSRDWLQTALTFSTSTLIPPFSSSLTPPPPPPTHPY